jgi:hypothetical protein
VRTTISELDDTDAKVALRSDSPRLLTADGHSHGSPDERDIEQLTGDHGVQLRPS